MQLLLSRLRYAAFTLYHCLDFNLRLHCFATSQTCSSCGYTETLPWRYTLELAELSSCVQEFYDKDKDRDAAAPAESHIMQPAQKKQKKDLDQPPVCIAFTGNLFTCHANQQI